MCYEYKCREVFIINNLICTRLTYENAVRKGISGEKFASIDSDNNGKFDSCEFLNNGILNNKVKSAFADLTGENYNENLGNKSFENTGQLEKEKRAPKSSEDKKSYA